MSDPDLGKTWRRASAGLKLVLGERWATLKNKLKNSGAIRVVQFSKLRDKNTTSLALVSTVGPAAVGGLFEIGSRVPKAHMAKVDAYRSKVQSEAAHSNVSSRR
jgi:hypothetical protein